jgi:hypothetical protein
MMCGFPEDVTHCRSLYTWLRGTAEYVCASIGHKGKARNDWLLGFAAGIHDQLVAAKRAAVCESEGGSSRPGSKAIVLITRRQAVENAASERLGKLAKHRMARARVALSVYNHGRETGRSTPLANQLQESHEP